MNVSTEVVPRQSAPQELSVSPGALLVRAREKQGVPAEKMCRDLGITATVLSALESDQLDKLPSPVYVKGYIRRYCDLVGIRPAPLLAALDDLYRKVNNPLGDECVGAGYRRGRLIWGGGLAFSLLALTAVSWALYPEGNEASAEQEMAASTLTLQKPQSAQEALVLNIVEDSWVEVVDARDHILAVNLYRAGSQVVLEGKPPFQVSLGAPSGVEVSYLGEPVEFKKDMQGQSAKLIVGQ